MKLNNLSGKLAYRSVATNSSAQAESLAKLSSGLRINGAKDDAAGLAISQKMKAQIRGLAQANNNINDAVNLTNTAGGGAEEIAEMVQRIRELTVQAANDTNAEEDRAAIQTEIDALTKEIDATAKNLEFNTIKVLNCADPLVISSNNSSTETGNVTTTSNTSTSTTTYVKLPKGDPVDTTPVVSTSTAASSSATVTYEESEQYLGKYDTWKDRFSFQSKEVVTVTSAEKITETTTQYTGNIIPSEVSTPGDVVSPEGVPRFTANSAGGTTINLYCALTEAKLQVGSTVYNLYSQSSLPLHSVQVDVNGDGSVIKNTFDPLGGIQVTQTVSLVAGADGNGTYKVGFDFTNVSGTDPAAFTFKFSMDAMNTSGATETATIDNDGTPLVTGDDTGILETSDAKVTISGDAGNIYYGDIGQIISAFDISSVDLGSFDGHTGAAMYWSNSLGLGVSGTGAMNYDVELKNDYYEYIKTVDETDTKKTITTENIVDEEIVPEQLAIQNGANEGQIYALRLYNLKCEKIGLTFYDGNGIKHAGIQVDSNQNCQTSLATLDRVINKISSARSYFGAAQNRMFTMMNSNSVTEENLSSTNSKIEDVDMAKEMMALVKEKILGQAATSMLSQSNNINTEMMQGLLQFP